MKKTFVYVLFLAFIYSALWAGTPVIDGAFDGTATWGNAVATADGITGWSAVNVDKLYVTNDATYAYFAASFHTDGYPGGWMRAGFAINVTTDGGWNCPWGAAVSYTYSPDDEKPDFVALGRFQDNWAELRDWTGSEWGGSGINIYDTEMEWASDYSYIECRIARSTLYNAAVCDVQFYVSGDNETEHGVFDACPDDEVMTSWNDPTELDNYKTDVNINLTSAISNSDVQPVKTHILAQNFPNPFNPTTHISYSLNSAAKVKLEIMNIAGQKICTLVNGLRSAGAHEITFSANELNTGVYFYRLTTFDPSSGAQTSSEARKMMIVK